MGKKKKNKNHEFVIHAVKFKPGGGEGKERNGNGRGEGSVFFHHPVSWTFSPKIFLTFKKKKSRREKSIDGRRFWNNSFFAVVPVVKTESIGKPEMTNNRSSFFLSI